jgi:signal transduction histidine kinase/DNA-binding response OmpR family regulator
MSTSKTKTSAGQRAAAGSFWKSWLLALLLFLFIPPLLGATYMMYLQSAKEIETRELQGDLVRARTLAAIVEKDLTSAETILAAIADRPSLLNDWGRHDFPSVEAQLQEARKLEPTFLFASIYETNGTLRAIVPSDPIVSRNFAYRDWYRGVTTHWQPYVSEVYRTAAGSGPLVVAVAVPMRDEHGKPAGILMATYSLAQLAAKFASIEKGGWEGFVIVDQHGILAASPEIRSNSDATRVSAASFVDRALAGTEGSARVVINGRDTFVGYAPIPRLGWAALYERPASQALAPAMHLKTEFRSVSLYLLLIYLTTAAFAALLMRRQTKLLAANQALNRELEDGMTAISETQAALVKAKEEAERSNKFKDQFLSTMSHELRTPLNAVLGFSDLLTEERYGPLTDRQRRYVNHIGVGGKHLLKLINDILDLSRIEAGRLQLAIETVRIDTAFGEAVDTMNPLANQKSQLLLRQPPSNLSVRADSTRLKQILINLLGNAVKFTPEGGKIELATRLAGESVRIDVRDSGPGIPPEEQKRIFEAFYRMTRKEQTAEGTGLGLAITQRLVELQGGSLGIESQPGSGSCFYFTLPVAPTIEVYKHESAPKPVGDHAPTILVIEDDPTAASLLEAQLTSVGYTVKVCDQPNLAVETVARLQPSAVTIDIIMKPINGWEILTKLKSDPRIAHIPVIVVSIVDQPSTGALLGADEYIVKPVEKSALLAAVDRCLQQTDTANQRTVLVVEDDRPTCEFIAESLSQQGYLVSTAADGEQARANLTAALPRLVILDLILPKVSGFQLLAEWRANARTANLPVFVLTSKDLTPEERNYLQANSSALFQKQQRWEDGLFKQLRRAVPPVAVEKT